MALTGCRRRLLPMFLFLHPERLRRRGVWREPQDTITLCLTLTLKWVERSFRESGGARVTELEVTETA